MMKVIVVITTEGTERFLINSAVAEEREENVRLRGKFLSNGKIR